MTLNDDAEEMGTLNQTELTATGIWSHDQAWRRMPISPA